LFSRGKVFGEVRDSLRRLNEIAHLIKNLNVEVRGWAFRVVTARQHAKINIVNRLV
jgi:hypothetical protein